MQLTHQILCQNLCGDISGGVADAIVTGPMVSVFGVVPGAGAAASLWGVVGPKRGVVGTLWAHTRTSD